MVTSQRGRARRQASRTWAPVDRNRELVRAADDGGLALTGIQDHPYQRHFFDTWSLIAALLGETRRISFFTDVANLPLAAVDARLLTPPSRPPACHRWCPRQVGATGHHMWL